MYINLQNLKQKCKKREKYDIQIIVHMYFLVIVAHGITTYILLSLRGYPKDENNKQFVKNNSTCYKAFVKIWNVDKYLH